MSRWSRFRALSWTERRALLEAVVLLAIAPVLVRWTRFHRGSSIVESPRNDGAEAGVPESRLAEARAIARMVAVAASYGFMRPRCLEHSLTLWLLLRRRGFDCDLRLGVRRADGRCEAHAWVEACGVSLNDRDDPHQRFAAFDVALIPARRDSFVTSAGSGTLASISRDIASAQ
jgi:Transglutaminase-like superfamily